LKSSGTPGDDPLLKVGIVMMAIALAFTVVAVVVIIIVRGEAEQAVASEAVAAKESSVEPLVRSYPPPVKPRVEEAKEPQPMAEPNPEPPPKPEPELKADPKPEPESEPKLNAQPEPTSHPPLRSDQPNNNALPAEEPEWQRPSEEELEAVSNPRRYELPPGAIMSLTVEAMDIYNVPVFDSDSQQALQDGVAHVPETSLPWSPGPQRNVYLAGHRMGYRGTWSRMVFYHLDKLDEGDEVVLKDRYGQVYRYLVSEAIVAGPRESWVMGQVRGRDMVTLQSCTPIPTFEKRLIVRAERV
jgi:sortase A